MYAQIWVSGFSNQLSISVFLICQESSCTFARLPCKRRASSDVCDWTPYGHKNCRSWSPMQ